MSFGFSLHNRLKHPDNNNAFVVKSSQQNYLPVGMHYVEGRWRNTQHEGVATLGSTSNLPYKAELATINSSFVNYTTAARIILVNPNVNILQSVFSKDLSSETVIILTENIHLPSIPNTTTIFAIKKERPGEASIITKGNITYVFGKIATVLLYSILFDTKKEVSSIFHYRLNYYCPQEKTGYRPDYKNIKNICELIDQDKIDKINLTDSTLICACHFNDKSDVKTIIKRCTMLANALHHKNIIYVFSLAPAMQDKKDYINSFSNNNVFFIQDVMNASRDGGKYLLALNSISIDNIYSNNGIITLFNDSVLMSNDLNRFSHDYNHAIKSYDIISCTSSMEKSYHTQSWFTSYINHETIKDYIKLASFISIDTTSDFSIRQSIIDQMEVGISTYLAVKYKTNALYSVHNMYYGSCVHEPDVISQNLRIALHICGFPFVKTRLIDEHGQASVGFNYHNFL